MQCTSSQAQALTEQMAADADEAAAQAEWTAGNSPKTNDRQKLTNFWGAFNKDALLSMDGQPGEFWSPQVGEDKQASTVCFGRTACNRAYVHLMNNPDDVAGAKHIAANYCVDHFDECAGDAVSYASDKNIQQAALIGLGGGGRRAPPAANGAVKADMAATSGFGNLSSAEAYGLKSYKDLRKATTGKGLQAHHLFEKRFASVFGQKESEMLSVAVIPAEHQVFTNAWRKAIPYGAATKGATRAQVESAKVIYKDCPAILKALGL